MTNKEALAVVALFQGAWGHVEVNERTMAVWYDVLRGVPADAGLEIARELVRTSSHFPSPSAFWTAWKAHQRHAALKANYCELPSGERVTPPDAAPAHLARLRDVLREVRA